MPRREISMNKKLFFVLLAVLTLPILVFGQRQIQQLLGLAAPRPANIIIETKSAIGPINKSWSAFAQGGEEAPPNLSPVVSKMKELSPRYIRLDHIYDSNNVVSKKDNDFVYDFSSLDKVVEDILAMGALPFFSLSYMPKDFTASGSVIDAPSDWKLWKNLVKETIEHYSGKNGRNLTDVYYEVWNEPELPQFGGWKMGSDKDYRLLYFYAAAGAKEANGVNKFYLGGPAVGSYYYNWVDDFLSYAVQNNLRLDFYSWHRYTKKPHEYASDVRKIRNLLSSYPSYANIPLILTEWGIDSENSDMNNTNIAAAYAIYSASKFNKDLTLAFNFEVKDGPPPTGGKWGLLTHERDPNRSISAKPKFKAFRELAKLAGNQILLSGDGTYISGIAAGDPAKITVILANYDLAGKNIENVPITFTGLNPGSYNLKYSYALDDRHGFFEIPTTSGTISKNFLLAANSVITLELTRISPLATFINGQSTQTNDRSLILTNIEAPLTFAAPEFHLLPIGNISFDVKPFWDKNVEKSFFILEAPFEITNGILDKLSLAKQKDALVFSISQRGLDHSLSIPINDWETGKWYHLEMGWHQNGFWFTAGGQKLERPIPLDVRNGKILTFSPVDVVLDNLKILIGKNEIIERHFDGRLDK